jgi:hypothetical protein
MRKGDFFFFFFLLSLSERTLALYWSCFNDWSSPKCSPVHIIPTDHPDLNEFESFFLHTQAATAIYSKNNIKGTSANINLITIES